MFGGQRIDVFHRQYRVYSGAFSNKPNLDEGGKIILPASALEELSRLHIVYPMLFEITNTREGVRTHCGVLEFGDQEGCVYIPYWMQQHLRLETGQIVTVKSATLPKGTYTKLRPQEKAFIDNISDPRAVLEKKLRAFSCLTRGDSIIIEYNGRNYCIDVLEVAGPQGDTEAVSIVETDIKVEFDRPADMPPSPPPEPATEMTAEEEPSDVVEEEEEPSFQAFAGQGFRLDGKQISHSPPPKKPLKKMVTSEGTVVSKKNAIDVRAKEEAKERRRRERQRLREERKKQKEVKFPGQGHTLK